MIGCAGWAGEDVVPLKYVGFGGMGGYVGRRICLDGGVLAGKLVRLLAVLVSWFKINSPVWLLLAWPL